MEPSPWRGVKRREETAYSGPLLEVPVQLANEGPEKSVARNTFILAELKVSPGVLAREPFTDRTPIRFPRMSMPWNTLWRRLFQGTVLQFHKDPLAPEPGP